MRRSVVTVLGTLFGLFCLGIFLYKADLPEVWGILASARLHMLLLLLFLAQMMNVFRAARWVVLLKPMAELSLWRSFIFTTIHFGSNVLLPARAGEFIKPLLAKRETKIGYSGIFATVVLERIFDLICLLSVLTIVLSTIGPMGSIADQKWIGRLQYAGLVMAAITASATLVIVGLALYREPTMRFINFFVKPLPEAISKRILSLVETFVSGLAAMRSFSSIAKAFFWSFMLWTTNIFFFYFSAKTLGFELSIFGSALVQVAIAFAVALPQGPGFIGVYQVAAEISLRIIGVSVSPAKAYAIITWVLSAVPTALLAIVFVSHEGATIASLSKQGQELAIEEGA